MKNQAKLPRTAGLRTLLELTDSLSKAGIDPQHIKARAEQLQNLHNEKRKRKRECVDRRCGRFGRAMVCGVAERAELREVLRGKPLPPLQILANESK